MMAKNPRYTSFHVNVRLLFAKLSMLMIILTLNKHVVPTKTGL